MPGNTNNYDQHIGILEKQYNLKLQTASSVNMAIFHDKIHNLPTTGI